MQGDEITEKGRRVPGFQFSNTSDGVFEKLGEKVSRPARQVVGSALDVQS